VAKLGQTQAEKRRRKPNEARCSTDDFGPDVAPNLATAGRLIGEAAAAGAQLVALPEYFPLIGATMRTDSRHVSSMASVRSRTFSLAQLASTAVAVRRLDSAAGGRTRPSLRNSCLVFDPQGQRVRVTTRSICSLQQGRRSPTTTATIERGDQVVAFDAPLGRIGIAICYDLRFPELFRAMGEIDLLVLPAAFTETTGRAHWELLLRARAVENQCYVLAAAQGGRHPTDA